MEATGSAETNLAGEKEHDKLLTRVGSGSFKGRYGDTGGGASSVVGNITTNPEGSSSNTSFANRDTSSRTSKDATHKKINEEESPKAGCKRKILKVVVTFLFIVIVVGVVVVWSLHEGRSRKHMGNQYFDFISKKRLLNVYDKDDDVILVGYLKISDFDVGKVRPCDSNAIDETYCFSFEDGTLLSLFPYKLEDTEVNCLNLIWENLNTYLHIPTDCYDVEYGLWYGLPNFQGAFWPLDLKKVSIDKIPYRPYWDEVLGHVLENYWLSTEGVAIIAHQNLPLKISYNSGNDMRLCLTLDFESVKSDFFPNLNYSICQGPDIKKTFIATRNTFFPNTDVIDFKNHDFSKIIWTYENKYHNNPDNFGEFLHKLNTANIPINMIQFDSNWEEHPGDFHFEALTRNEITKYLQGKYSSTKLMLPVTLACSVDSDNFRTGVTNRLFGKNMKTQSFQTIRYLDQSCALWDASNPKTREFLKNAFLALQQIGTAEETEFPQAYEFQTTIGSSIFPLLLFENSTDINLKDLEFLNVLIDLNKSVLIETAFRLQNRPIFVQVPTVVANKNGKKCLDYIISGALTAGIHGYPFIVSQPPPEDKVDQELFTRWLQVAMFFPGLKVTNMAVNFGGETINVTKKLSFYRQSVVIPFFSDFIPEVEKGYPLLRPMWWVNPMDYKTLKISDQFLIGTSLVVAPVLCHGDRKRDIYLPEGSWMHARTGKYYDGKQWLKDFEVLLGDIPVFQAYNRSDVNATTESSHTAT